MASGKFMNRLVDTTKKNEIVFTGTYDEIAEYLKLTKGYCSRSAAQGTLIQGKYLIEKCGGENIKEKVSPALLAEFDLTAQKLRNAKHDLSKIKITKK